MFKRIVAGHDGTVGGRDAVALAAAIAETTGAQLSLVYVFSPSLIPISGMTDRRTLRAVAERALRAERHHLARTATVHIVTDPSSARGIRHHAERFGADLVVIGSSHLTPAGEVRIGRCGRQLVWDAPFPVLLARRGLADDAVAIRSVTVGYHGGREAEIALGFGASFAAEVGASLAVMTVVEHHPHALGQFLHHPGELIHHKPADSVLHRPDELDARLEEERAATLERVRLHLAELDVNAELTAVVGDPGHCLQAASHETDLIVIGSRRWGAFARVVSGSVGETLVGEASCSVAVVPRPARSGHSPHAIRRTAAAG